MAFEIEANIWIGSIYNKYDDIYSDSIVILRLRIELGERKANTTAPRACLGLTAWPSVLDGTRADHGPLLPWLATYPYTYNIPIYTILHILYIIPMHLQLIYTTFP